MYKQTDNKAQEKMLIINSLARYKPNHNEITIQHSVEWVKSETKPRKTENVSVAKEVEKIRKHTLLMGM